MNCVPFHRQLTHWPTHVDDDDDEIVQKEDESHCGRYTCYITTYTHTHKHTITVILDRKEERVSIKRQQHLKREEKKTIFIDANRRTIRLRRKSLNMKTTMCARMHALAQPKGQRATAHWHEFNGNNCPLVRMESECRVDRSPWSQRVTDTVDSKLQL